MEGRTTPDSLASELSSRSLVKQNSIPDGKENESLDAKQRGGFMAPTQSSMRKKDLIPTGQPLAPRLNSATPAIPEEEALQADDAPTAPVARSLQELRCR